MQLCLTNLTAYAPMQALLHNIIFSYLSTSNSLKLVAHKLATFRSIGIEWTCVEKSRCKEWCLYTHTTVRHNHNHAKLMMASCIFEGRRSSQRAAPISPFLIFKKHYTPYKVAPCLIVCSRLAWVWLSVVSSDLIHVFVCNEQWSAIVILLWCFDSQSRSVWNTKFCTYRRSRNFRR